MYLTKLKAAVTEALQATFDASYPEPDFRDLHVSIEFPNDKTNYPGIWVGYEDTGPLERAGIDHRETVLDTNGYHEVTRWRFQGSISFTIAALTSYQRDRIYDEMVRILAFASVDKTRVSNFHNTVESNDFLGINIQYDVLNASGDAASPGTPWGTQEVIYERTLSTDVIGEFVSDPSTNELVTLSSLTFQGYIDGSVTPDFTDLPPDSGRPYDPGVWN